MHICKQTYFMKIYLTLHSNVRYSLKENQMIDI